MIAFLRLNGGAACLTLELQAERSRSCAENHDSSNKEAKIDSN
jgi:hypothetical protein